MKTAIAALVLFALQVYLVVFGAYFLGKYWKPSIILGISAIIPILYLNKTTTLSAKKFTINNKWVSMGIVSVGLIICGILLKRVLLIQADISYSDVLPQLEALYQRFSHGEQPYYPVQLPGYAAFPVYMPLHWLPLGISQIVGFDKRWVGFLMLAATLLFYAWKQKGMSISILAGLLPLGVLFAFIIKDRADMAATFETTIAAYYLLLAIGLAVESLRIVILGIVCCLLSRYTLVFWIPLFAILLWANESKKNSFITWGIVAAAVIGLYLLPFYSHDPSILRKGIAYHNQCAVEDWRGYGNPPVSWTQEAGLSFGAAMKAIFPGDVSHQVMLSRILQSLMMLGLVIIGVWYYQKKEKHRTSFYQYSLVMLYYCLLLFYLFGPLTYRYYWMSLLMITAVMVADTVSISYTGLFRQNKNTN